MSVYIEAGTYVHTDAHGELRTNRPLSPLLVAMLRQAIVIAGDPDGERTHRVQLGEGTATVHIERRTDDDKPVIVDDEIVYDQITVNLVAPNRIEETR